MKEFANKTDQELKALAAEKRSALRDFRFGIAGSKVRNVKEGKDLRRDLARILTALRARSLAARTS